MFTLQQVLIDHCNIGGFPPKSNCVSVYYHNDRFYKYVSQGFKLDNRSNKYQAFKLIDIK